MWPRVKVCWRQTLAAQDNEVATFASSQAPATEQIGLACCDDLAKTTLGNKPDNQPIEPKWTSANQNQSNMFISSHPALAGSRKVIESFALDSEQSQ